MQRSRPLATTNPEFSVLEWPGFREYRVENWHLARDGSQRVIKGATGLDWKLAIASVVLGLFWMKIRESTWATITASVLCVYFVWVKCTQVLYESVIVIAPHGIQLETHRGFPPSSVLSASRRFIPMSALQDFVINEGLRRWNVRYYLTAIQRNGENDFSLHVAYENILPHIPVLLEVYKAVQTMLFSNSS
ncbi:hypothetical protein PILCRDRAFT_821977 [Piloderma croceum F 1598]|uniref:Phosphatidylinositol N-acetylglucosaminyltransferase subunit H conserved domain-containing protein n=1 Tax=Piloderma croceum (strain F 1598) TaxID=765440 RepID=A0A0C3FN91_PILCF|nr:hypothetical protein PILCRDRAFT_821977 [Piloderma croceum F 1598]